MSNSTYKLSLRKLAKKWALSPSTIRRLAKRGIDFDASDQEVAELIMRKCMKKSKACYEAIYAHSDIEPRKPLVWNGVRWTEEMPEMSFDEMIKSLGTSEEIRAEVDRTLKSLGTSDEIKAELDRTLASLSTKDEVESKAPTDAELLIMLDDPKMPPVVLARMIDKWLAASSSEDEEE